MNVQVRNGQKQLQQLQRKLQAALRAQMKKTPALQPYARKPYTSYIVYFIAAVPALVFVSFVLPILGTILALLFGMQPHFQWLYMLGAELNDHHRTCCFVCKSWGGIRMLMLRQKGIVHYCVWLRGERGGGPCLF